MEHFLNFFNYRNCHVSLIVFWKANDTESNLVNNCFIQFIGFVHFCFRFYSYISSPLAENMIACKHGAVRWPFTNSFEDIPRCVITRSGSLSLFSKSSTNEVDFFPLVYKKHSFRQDSSGTCLASVKMLPIISVEEDRAMHGKCFTTKLMDGSGISFVLYFCSWIENWEHLFNFLFDEYSRCNILLRQAFCFEDVNDIGAFCSRYSVQVVNKWKSQ